MFRLLFGLLLIGLTATDAAAQLRLPSFPDVRAPGIGLPRAQERLTPIADPLAPADLLGQRAAIVDDLLRRYARQVILDPIGNPTARTEIIAITPSSTLLAAAQQLGLSVARDTLHEPLNLRVVVFRLPTTTEPQQAIAALRRADPAAELDYNHLYVRSGAAGGPVPSPLQKAATTADTFRIGLIDGGVEAGHPALHSISLHQEGCQAAPVPTAHGTAVAALLAAAASASPAALHLYAADIFCGGLPAGTVSALADAMAWLVRERIPVINISLVGPPNLLLGRVVRAAAAKGHLIVAAVGNDGPHAAPLYPAAYEEVVGVTGIDARGHILPEALQGPQVKFAALGLHPRVAVLSGRYSAARGTSFAAPLVAVAFARMYGEPRANVTGALIEELARHTRDLGTPGRDPVFGFGLVDPSVAAVAGGVPDERMH